MARTLVVLEETYLPHSLGEVLSAVTGEPTGKHEWEKVLYSPGDVVDCDDLAPDFVELVAQNKAGFAVKLEGGDYGEEGGEGASGQEPSGGSSEGAEGGQVPEAVDPGVVEGGGTPLPEPDVVIETIDAPPTAPSNVEPGGAEPPSPPQPDIVETLVQPDGGVEPGTPLPEGYAGLNVKDIESASGDWSEGQLSAALDYERQHDNRKTAVEALESELAKRGSE